MSSPATSAELQASLVDARAAWPGIDLPDATYFAYVKARMREGQSCIDLCTKELFLTCACLRHDPTALLAFENRYLSQVRAMVAHLRLSSANLDDLEQQLRSELLVAETGREAKLGSYQGQGALLGWIRVTAVRAALRLLPAKTDTSSDDANMSELVAVNQNPELAYLKAADQTTFKTAFAAAMNSLPPKDQNLLRQHYIDGLSIDRLGELHRTHRTSCARWLRQARMTLFRRTKSLLMKQTNGSVSECDSLIRRAQSQLEITFRSLLR